jgi:hypothetical protein
VVLTQLAYQFGPLVASLPAITIVNPLLSIVIGVVVYDEDIRQGPGPIAAMTGLLDWVVAAAAVQGSPSSSSPRPPRSPTKARDRDWPGRAPSCTHRRWCGRSVFGGRIAREPDTKSP